MSKKERNAPQAEHQRREPFPGRPGTLLQRLLQTFAGPREQAREESSGDGLAPAGRRSGSGVASIEPYLDEARSTRPGPLE